jgi:N6-L-threonylcarbamoyladenine synthase
MRQLTTLAVETSCDETAAALLVGDQVVAEQIHSQVDLHRFYGGVVPELASRDHVAHIGAVCAQVLAAYDGPIELVAATRGPGLIGGLLVGLQWAKAFAAARSIPFVGVHHLAGHLCACRLDPEFGFDPPFLALLVSGGHTKLYAVEAWGVAREIGATRDDAAGEAFDKAARMLKLGYPGGPAIQQAAAGWNGAPYKLPRPMLNRGCEMSFSGLKTALRDLLERRDPDAERPEELVAEMSHALQAAIVDVLVTKSRRAMQQTGIERLVIGGGVAANGPLRSALGALTSEGYKVYIPAKRWCTDNAAMIGAAGRLQFAQKGADSAAINGLARWPLTAHWAVSEAPASSDSHRGPDPA